MHAGGFSRWRVDVDTIADVKGLICDSTEALERDQKAAGIGFEDIDVGRLRTQHDVEQLARPSAWKFRSAG